MNQHPQNEGDGLLHVSVQADGEGEGGRARFIRRGSPAANAVSTPSPSPPAERQPISSARTQGGSAGLWPGSTTRTRGTHLVSPPWLRAHVHCPARPSGWGLVAPPLHREESKALSP